MAIDINLHRLRASQQLEQLQTASASSGAALGELVNHVLQRFHEAITAREHEVLDLLTGGYSDTDYASLASGLKRKYERLADGFSSLYDILTRYRNCVDRADVPIGVQHVLDELVDALVGPDADPMIHPHFVDMYSIVPVKAMIQHLQPASELPAAVQGYKGRQPIIVNVPALDPANGLLMPLLAHEVAHAGAADGLRSELDSLTMSTRTQIQERATRLKGRQQTDARVAFRLWSDELLCDAVALLITGPSFLFAFHGYPPTRHNGDPLSHPTREHRLRFHLETLQELGWTEFLEENVPPLMEWYRTHMIEDAPDEGSIAEFVREAILEEESAILETARSFVDSNSGATQFAPPADLHLYDGVRDDFSRGVPDVQQDGITLGTWDVVLAGWLAVLRSDPSVEGAQRAILDQGFSAMLVKALELSGIATRWEKYVGADL